MEPIDNTSCFFDWISFLFGGVGIVLLSAICRLRYWILKPKITYPSDGDTVPHQIIVEGTYSRLVKKQDIWVFVYPMKAGRFYPQKIPAVKETNGKWRAIAYFGRTPHVENGDPFIIYVVTANFKGTQSILEYIIDCIPKKVWPGLPGMPTGCREHQSVNVKRR